MTNNIKTFNELYRKIKIVESVRYISARRLKLHQQLSQWVITILSVLLIIAPLIQALQVPVKHSNQLINAAQVFLAILVLSYSQLLSAENYGSRSEKMQSCGLELSFLAREIYPHINSNHKDRTYRYFSEKYQSILVKHENHHQVDYQINTLDEKYSNCLQFYIINIRYYLGFWHYAIFTVTSISVIVYLLS